MNKMLCKRIIACLDVRSGSVVKGIRFADLRTAGDPADLARRYNHAGIDELVILDVTATLEDRRARAATIAAVARELFIPLTAGGGIRAEADAAAVLDAGADKVSLNTAALADPSLITRLAARYGSQAVVVAIDARRDEASRRLAARTARPRASGVGRRGPTSERAWVWGGAPREEARFVVYVRSGETGTGRLAIDWAREAADRGAGEILLTSIDRDGTRDGFDCDLTSLVSDSVRIPVIASGGAGSFDHFVDVFTRGRADAALAASIFHYDERSVCELKAHLGARGIPVRL